MLATRVENLDEQAMLLAVDGDRFFTEPHDEHHPTVLVQLDGIDTDELSELLTDAWRTQAPADLVRAFDTGELA